MKRVLALLSALLAFAILSGCARPEEPARVAEDAPPRVTREESPPQPAQAKPEVVAEPTPKVVVKLPPPKLDDFKDALARLYQDAVVIDAARVPYFLVADFNGDGSEDAAVVVTPAEGMLGKINDEVANWILEDPTNVSFPEFAKYGIVVPRRSSRTRVEKGDALLAVIHGKGPRGWRDPDISHTYLLRNAVGADMKPQSKKEFSNAMKLVKPLPMVTGDVIATTLKQQRGFLLYSSGKYAWFSPRKQTR